MWCVNCDTKVYDLESRQCNECIHFKAIPYNIPICKKKLMGVTTDMHVTYKVTEGTCFEPKIDQN
jgi:hypothetical protein